MSNCLKAGGLTLATLCALVMVSGCRICADCEDTAYPAYGGRWQRTLRDQGRVGSLFDPAGGLAPDVAPRDAPPEADELDRRRYQRRGGVTDPEELDEDSADRGAESQPGDLRERQDSLRDRQLDEIEIPGEQERREKELDEIDIRRSPRPAAPPRLH